MCPYTTIYSRVAAPSELLLARSSLPVYQEIFFHTNPGGTGGKFLTKQGVLYPVFLITRLHYSKL